jgi:ABC-2 type transport system permease protein
MMRTLVDMKAFAIQYLRNPFGAIFSIGFPLLLLVTLGAVFGQMGDDEVHLLIQDMDGTNTSMEFIEEMNWTAENRSGVFLTYMAKVTDVIKEDGLNEHELTAALIIPAGFESKVDNGTAVELMLVTDRSIDRYGEIDKAVNKAVRTFEEGRSLPDDVVRIRTREVKIDEFVFIDFFLPGIIALAIMLNCLMILSSLMADYWAHGYFKILKTTPLKKWEWILSKLLWYMLIMGASVLLMVVVGVYGLGADATFTPIAVALIVAGIILFSAIGMLIGAWAKNSDTAAGIGNAIGQPMMFLSGIFWDLDSLPEIVGTIAKVFPLTYLGEGLRSTMIDGNDTVALENLAVVLVLAVVFFLIASKVISWKEK